MPRTRRTTTTRSGPPSPESPPVAPCEPHAVPKRDLGPLAPVLTPSSAFDDSGALIEAVLRLCDPQIAASLNHHAAWKTVRAITMPKVPDPSNRRARALDDLVFANRAMGRLERVTMMRYGALGAWLRSKQRPHTLGVAWLDDLWQVLDLLLAMDDPPKRLEIDNPHADLNDWSQPLWERFWSSKLVANLEHLELRLVNVRTHHWEALRDHKIRRAVFEHGGKELVWTSTPPTLTVPAFPLPKAKAARSKAEFHRAYLKQELARVPRGIKIATLSE